MPARTPGRDPLLRRPGHKGWPDPPILDNPSETKTIDGREYEIFFDGDRVRLVAWHRGDNTYWVANNLLNTLDQRPDGRHRALGQGA